MGLPHIDNKAILIRNPFINNLKHFYGYLFVRGWSSTAACNMLSTDYEWHLTFVHGDLTTGACTNNCVASSVAVFLSLFPTLTVSGTLMQFQNSSLEFCTKCYVYMIRYRAVVRKYIQ